MEIREQEIIKKEYKKIYVANDGLEFSSEEECKKYEESAKGAINAMFNSLEHHKVDQAGDDMPYYWCCDDELLAVKIHNETELRIVNQKLSQINNYYGELLPASAIGTVQVIEFYDYCNGGEPYSAFCVGTPEEMKKKYCDWIDKRFVKPFEESEQKSE